MANPYFAFAAMMMAGLDGIQNKIHPGDAMDKDLYDLPPEEEKQLKTGLLLASTRRWLHWTPTASSCSQGDVFDNDLIDGYIELKKEEVTRLRMSTHPSSSTCTTACKGYDRRPCNITRPASRAFNPGRPYWFSR